MIRRKPAHLSSLPVSSQASKEISPDESGLCVRKSSRQKVDDLLKAFSDTAYSSEEEEHAWESWNYSRLSFF